MTDASAHELERQLATLEVGAPDRLAIEVLLEVDLADRCVHRRIPDLDDDLLVSYNGRGISSVEFSDRASAETIALALRRPVVEADAMPDVLAQRLERALATHRLGSLPLDLRGISDFRVRALRKAAEIPPGEVRPYGWIARELGAPGAVRAVGSAMATNRLPVLLPCHRVVPSDGSLGNYGGGVDRKRALLASEGLDVDELETRARSGVRFVGSDTTRIFCLPTCRHARRVADAHRVEFRAVADAHERGYRSCAVCRPA